MNKLNISACFLFSSKFSEHFFLPVTTVDTRSEAATQTVGTFQTLARKGRDTTLRRPPKAPETRDRRASAMIDENRINLNSSEHKTENKQ